jgi:hypothetical protein
MTGAELRATVGDPAGDHVVLDASRLTIELRRVHRLFYEIDLERHTSSAVVLDTIMQLASKTWMTPEMLGLTVLALNVALYPQSTLCSGGFDRRLAAPEIPGLVRGRVRALLRKPGAWFGRRVHINGRRWPSPGCARFGCSNPDCREIGHHTYTASELVAEPS